MSTPVLHLLAGPNGAGKTTFVERLLVPVTGLAFVNADVIAAQRWPHDQAAQAYDASRAAAAERAALLRAGTSFITGTVFSHPSKLELLRQASACGYLVTLHVVLVPVELSVARVTERVGRGGHAVPEEKIRQRHQRLWALVAEATQVAERTVFYDNTTAARPFREVARFADGRPLGTPDWPAWAPRELGTRTTPAGGGGAAAT